MMVEVRQNGEEGEVADSHIAFARLADASAKLFAEQASAMAAMTAFGISFAGQMTGMMLDALKSVEEKPAGTPLERASMNVASTEGNVVHLRAKSEKRDGEAELADVEPAKVEAGAAEAAARPARKALPRKAVGAATAAKPRSAQSPADDLKRISGIGPRLEKVLNGLGISTYAGIAGLGAAALKKIDDDLGLEGRVIRDDWAGQAKALAAGRPNATR